MTRPNGNRQDCHETGETFRDRTILTTPRPSAKILDSCATLHTSRHWRLAPPDRLAPHAPHMPPAHGKNGVSRWRLHATLADAFPNGCAGLDGPSAAHRHDWQSLVSYHEPLRGVPAVSLHHFGPRVGDWHWYRVIHLMHLSLSLRLAVCQDTVLAAERTGLDRSVGDSNEAAFLPDIDAGTTGIRGTNAEPRQGPTSLESFPRPYKMCAPKSIESS
ncbi:hypothetical protein FN846DRAFT_885731 [Sphaerosporella brunnea]|uniref:Uncharacterized protein n=1 Tax=Sphaerosporella brunnea TaxID=1250544 RepID=A0A5J5FAU8_9PEZI|nr:hypothetical protein FN846DRAFT_885731 [Sphaerosporella brunnea]